MTELRRLARTLAAGIGVALSLVHVDATAASLHELLQQALQQAPQQTELQARTRTLQAEEEQAARWLPGAPELSVTALSDTWTEQQGQQEWEVELGAPLWRSGQRQHQMQSASQARQQWRAEQAALALQLAGEVREAVWQVQNSATRQRLAEQRLANAQALERDVARRVAAGELARADQLLAASDSLAADSQLTTSTQEWHEAQARLFLLTGTDAQPDTAEETLASATAVPPSHPLLRAAEAEAALARARWQASRSGAASPAAALIWKQDRDNRDEDFRQTVGVKVSLPLGADRSNRAAVAAARAEQQTADARLQQTRRNLQSTLATAQAALASAIRQHDQATRQDTLAQENLTLSRRAFDAGELDLLSLLKLQGNALDATENRELKALARQRAVARVNQALGVLP